MAKKEEQGPPPRTLSLESPIPVGRAPESERTKNPPLAGATSNQRAAGIVRASPTPGPQRTAPHAAAMPAGRTVEQSAWDGQRDSVHDGRTAQLVRPAIDGAIETGPEIVTLPHAGAFQMLDIIASGGMGSIRRAKQIGAAGFDRVVAIKETLTGNRPAEDEANRKALRDEAQMLSCLRHPHIAQVQNFDEMEGAFYLILEFVEGKSLSEWIALAAERGRTLSASLACEVVAQVAEALQYAYEEATDRNGRPLRLVHRDLSPQNLMVGESGTAKLLDFGIAVADGIDRSNKTKTGMVRGKPAYLSPEQAVGDALDCRSDIFALGLCLAETIAGRRVYDGPSHHDVIRRIAGMGTDEIDAVLARLPAPLQPVAGKALSKSRDERYASHGEFAGALRGYLVSQGISFRASDIAAELRALLAAEDVRAADSDRPVPPTQVHTGRSKSVPPKGISRQARDVSGSGGKLRRLAWIAAVVIVLGAGAALYFGLRERASHPASEVAAAPPTTSAAPAVTSAALATSSPAASTTSAAPLLDDEVRSQQKAKQAQTRFDLGEYEAALTDWKEAYRLKQQPEILRRLAETRALLKQPTAKTESLGKVERATQPPPRKTTRASGPPMNTGNSWGQ